MRDFWSRDPLMSSAIFPQKMTRDRFDALTSALPFADNEADYLVDDRLWKLRPVLSVPEEMFSTVFVPNKTISVDESHSRGTTRHFSTCQTREHSEA